MYAIEITPSFCCSTLRFPYSVFCLYIWRLKAVVVGFLPLVSLAFLIGGVVLGLIFLVVKSGVWKRRMLIVALVLLMMSLIGGVISIWDGMFSVPKQCGWEN